MLQYKLLNKFCGHGVLTIKKRHQLEFYEEAFPSVISFLVRKDEYLRADLTGKVCQE